MPTAGHFKYLTLVQQFAVTGAAVVIVTATAVGFWVTDLLEASIVRHASRSSGLYMATVLTPLGETLRYSDILSDADMAALNALLEGTPLGARVASYKLWKPGGLIVAASDPAMVGRRFSVTDNLRDAWRGHIRAEFSSHVDPEDRNEAALGVPLLEVYSPIRHAASGEVVVIAEFYEVNSELSGDLVRARWSTWLTVFAVLISVGAILFAIVRRASRLIELQQRRLSYRLAHLRDLSNRNTALRLHVQEAAARVSAMNERTLRSIGADLHDGPAQLLGFATMRLDSLVSPTTDHRRSQEIETISTSLREALQDLRRIARGLSLPEIERQPIREVVASAVQGHQAHTRSRVEVFASVDTDWTDALSPAIKICTYRFVQEGLNNAWKHGGVQEQTVRLRLQGGTLHLEVGDSGPGFRASQLGLGLSGLRDRVEALGGALSVGSRQGGGTILAMELSVESR